MQAQEQYSYEQLPGEPGNWYARFLFYRDMGAVERSLQGAYVSYIEKAGKGRKKPVTDVPGAWKEKADQWHWKQRAEAYDAYMQAQAKERAARLQAIEDAEIARILTTDYAAKHERVKGLARMAHIIEDAMMTLDEDTGEKKVNPKWIDALKIREWRGCLDDIAKELGDRVARTKTELTGKDGGPLEFETQWGNGASTEESEE